MTLFDFDHYQDYLKATFNRKSEGWGKRSALAQFLNCQTSFISQVLAKRVHMSLEHAIKVSEFLGHNLEEQRFFMLLVQRDRSGSNLLEQFYTDQIEKIKEKRQLIKEQIKVNKEISASDQAIYYSSWWYSAIHILAALPSFNDVKSISRYLNLPEKIVKNVVDFLIGCSLIQEKEGNLEIGMGRIHLGSKSPLVSRHHLNWRQKANQVIEQMDKKNLHYSAIVGISKQDAIKIKSLILELLEKSEKIISESGEEAPYALLMDFFHV